MRTFWGGDPSSFQAARTKGRGKTVSVVNKGSRGREEVESDRCGKKKTQKTTRWRKTDQVAWGLKGEGKKG